MPLARQIPDFGLANEHEKDEEAANHVEAANHSQKYFKVEIAVNHIRVVAMQLNVDAFRQPREAHDEKKLGEEHELLTRVAVETSASARGS